MSILSRIECLKLASGMASPDEVVTAAKLFYEFLNSGETDKSLAAEQVISPPDNQHTPDVQ